MKHKKRLLSLLLTISMAISLIPATVMADSEASQGNEPESISVNATRGTSVFDSYEDAARYVCESNLAGNSDVTFRINLATPIDISTAEIRKANVEAVFSSITNLANKYLSENSGGDYIRYHIDSYGYGTGSMEGTEVSSILCRCVTYFRCTEAQMSAADAAIDEVIRSFGFTDETTQSEKFMTIYNYIVKNTNYSHTIPNETDPDLEYTAYAAIVRHTAVCQGYALLLNRMLEKVGIENRIISGVGINYNSEGAETREAHAWNVVKIDETWYNVDATWDSTGFYPLSKISKYYMMNYRLKSDSDFPRHERNTEYLSADFVTDHPTNGTSYASDPAFLGHQVYVEHDIGVRYMIYVPAEVDASRAYVEFNLSSGRKTRIYISNATPVSATKYPGLYWVTCDINARELADQITTTMYTGTASTVGDTYSVLEYCESIRKNADAYGQKAVDLVNAIQDYGHYMQASKWADSRDHESIPCQTVYTSTDIERVIPLVSEYAFKRTNDSYIDVVSYSLSMNSQISINLYMKLQDGYTFTGSAFEEITRNEQLWYKYTKREIGPLKFKTMYTIQGSKVSVLSYANAVLTNPNGTFSQAEQFAMVALYDYQAKAWDYYDAT